MNEEASRSNTDPWFPAAATAAVAGGAVAGGAVAGGAVAGGGCGGGAAAGACRPTCFPMLWPEEDRVCVALVFWDRVISSPVLVEELSN